MANSKELQNGKTDFKKDVSNIKYDAKEFEMRKGSNALTLLAARKKYAEEYLTLLRRMIKSFDNAKEKDLNKLVRHLSNRKAALSKDEGITQ